MASTFEQLIEALRQTIGDPSLEFLNWERNRSQHGTPPRVAWVPLGGNIEPATRNGPIQVPGVNAQFYPIYDDVLAVQAHIWARGFEDFERILQKLLSGTKEVFGTNSRPGAYQVTTEAEESGQVQAEQVKAVLLFQWRTTVGRSRKPLVPGALGEAGPKIPAFATVVVAHQAHACSLDTTP